MPRTEALADVAAWLACPVCLAGMSVDGGSLGCANGHRFDIARQGHVNLLGRGAPKNADTANMVAARERLLATGLFDPVADAVADALAGCRSLLEVGAGPGRYISRVLEADRQAHGLASDVSPHAARRAARAHPRLAAVVADTWRPLPLRDGVIDGLLCVFAPRNADEFARVLTDGGRCAVVVPRTSHLGGLRERLGLIDVAGDKASAVQRSMAPLLRLVGCERVRSERELTSDQVTDLVAMGPNAFHRVPEALPPATVTVDVDVLVLERQARETSSE